MKALFPLAIWLAWVLLLGEEFRLNHWECLLVMFAAIELVPRGLRLMGHPQGEMYTFFAVLFCAAYFFDGYWWLALPYAGWAVWYGIRAAGDFRWNPQGRSLAHALRLFALAYWATGAAFAVMYLADWQPMGFDPVIVSLTAAHFHVAGFVMTVLAYYQLEHFSDAYSRMLGVLALAGMPLVAAGITMTQLGRSPVLEQFGATFFVFFALAMAFRQLQLYKKKDLPALRRGLWATGALCLIAGAWLAAAYALRFQWPVDWVNIPNMKYWHGTLNTLGFAWLSLLGCESART